MIDEKLNDSSNIFEAIVETASDVIMTFDEQGKIKTCNSAVAEMFGYSPEDLIGADLGMVMSDEYYGDHDRRFQGFLSAGETGFLGIGRRIEAKKKDGSVIPVSFTISVLKFQNRKYFSVVLRDINKILHTERELEEMARDLARSNSLLEEFASLAAHDLHAPLRTVTMLTARLAKQPSGTSEAAAVDLIRRIQASSQRMQILINDLLRLCQIRKAKGVPLEVDIGLIFDNVAADLLATISENTASVSRDDMPQLTGDESQLRQLIQNLIANAIKFRRPGIAPEVRFSANEGPSHWEFCISDNGIGINSKNFNRILLPFQRLHGRNEFPGNGIGLALCKEIVERHGGTIRIESKEGEGSKFYFTIEKVKS